MVLGFDINDLPEDRLRIMRDEYSMSDAQIREQVQETVLQQISRRIHDFEAREPVIQGVGRRQGPGAASW